MKNGCVVTVGGPDWEPTQEDLDRMWHAFQTIPLQAHEQPQPTPTPRQPPPNPMPNRKGPESPPAQPNNPTRDKPHPH